jgi:hypothetical protein
MVIDLQSVADLERDGLAALFLGPFGQSGPGSGAILALAGRAAHLEAVRPPVVSV